MAYSALILCMEYGPNKRECSPIAEHIITGSVQRKCQHDSQRSRNHRCSGKAKRIAYSEYVCVCVCVCVCSLTNSYPASKAHAQHYIVICGLPGSKVFSILSQKRHDLRKRKVIEHEMCSNFLHKFRLRYFSF